MSRVQLITGFLVFAFIAQVAAHGHLSVPHTRDLSLSKRQDEQNMPVAYPLSSDFVCRNYAAQPRSSWTTLVAGNQTSINWGMEAAHPGDCSVYITYDGDQVADTDKKWFKIKDFPQCNLQNTQTLSFTIPSYLPPCDHCILRWEWYALHLQAIDIVEFYSQCADVRIVGNPSGSLPTPQFTIPGHLPMDAKHYRLGFNTVKYFITGPPEASVGGASYDCVQTYGSSCLVPSPTKNPCNISTQRCMSATTYQACGIGQTTTVWGPEQSCQTGLVCANHDDGVHIMCTYPTASNPLPPASSTPSTPSATPSSPSTPVSTVVEGSDGSCTNQDMKCVGDSTYQTCAHGSWAAAQSCQTGLFCTPNGKTVYCSSSKPSAPVATPSVPVATPSTPIATPSTTGMSAPSTTGRVIVQAPVQPAPIQVGTTGLAAVVTPPGSGSINIPSSNSCTSGDQKCTSVGSNTYQTCSHGSWAAAQSCQTGLSCHPSATANNIYCY